MNTLALLIQSSVNSLVLLVFVASAPRCAATLVTTACSAERIVLASDGLLMTPGGVHPNEAACKIQQSGNDCFYVMIGLYSFNTPQLRFRLAPIAARACKGHGSIEERARRFQTTSLAEVTRAVTYLKKHDPADYAYIDPFRLDVVFAGGTPLTVAEVGYKEDASGHVVIDETHICTPRFVQAVDFRAIGDSQYAMKYVIEHPVDREKADMADLSGRAILAAINFESKQQPRIGLPVEILSIDREGPKWIQQGVCRDIKQRGKH